MGLHWELNVVMLGTSNTGDIEVFGRRPLSCLALPALNVTRKCLLQEKHTNCVIQYRMINPENTHMSGIIQTEQVIFRNICI